MDYEGSRQASAFMPASKEASGMWWHDEQRPLSADQSKLTKSYIRPSVTTGASLPWRGKASSSLGPPRAFYSGPSSLPTITVSSCQPGMAKLVCKQEPGTSSLLLSPFAEPHAAAEAGVEMDSKEEGFEETNHLDGETSAERQYQKQESMQSTTTSLPESSGPCQAGQVITTAQDAQGMTVAAGQTLKGSEASWRVPNAIAQASSQPVLHEAIITSNSSIYPGQKPASADAKVGERRRQSSVVPVDDSGQPRKMVARQRVLRSAPARRYTDSPHRQTEELAKAGSLCGDTKGTSSELEDMDLDETEQRRIRRRNNNRESAKRIREKRDAELKSVNDKILQLQAAQTQLMEHCATLEGTCLHLSQELQLVQSKWDSSKEENMRLMTEVEHMRKNVELGGQASAAVNLELPNGSKAHAQPASMMASAGGLAEDLTALEWDLYNSNNFVENISQDWQSW